MIINFESHIEPIDASRFDTKLRELQKSVKILGFHIQDNRLSEKDRRYLKELFRQTQGERII